MPRSNVSLVRDIGVSTKTVPSNIGCASNLGELIDLVPAPFLARTRILVNEVYAAAKKSNNARSYLSTLEKHKIDHTFPPEIGGRVNTPALQISKEYSASAQCKAELQALDTRTRAHKEALLESAIAVKRNEVTFLQSQFAEDRYKEKVNSIYTDVVAQLASDAGVAPGTDGSFSIASLPQWIQTDCTTFWHCGPLFVGRAVALAHAANQQEMSKKFKALSLKRRTDGDIEMQDPDVRNDSIQAIVQRELAKALKGQGLQNSSKKNAKNKRNSPKNASPRKAGSSRSPGSGKGNGRGRAKNRTPSK